MADIFISPAPERFDKGIMGFGSVERRMNIIADALEIELNRLGISSQRAPSGCAVFEAVAMSNANLPKAHVALYAFSSDSSKSGFEIYHNQPHENGERLASDIADAVSEICNTEVFDAKTEFGGLGFYELTNTLAPSVIVMTGYQDNKDDVLRIIDKGYFLSCAIAKGLAEYLGKSYSPPDISFADNYNGIRFD